MARRVIVDTSAIYALLSASDEFHSMARQQYQDLIDRGDELHVTSYVLVEAGALVHRRLGFEPLRAFMEVAHSLFQIFWVDREVHMQAWEHMAARGGAGLSFVDWTTVVAAQRIRAIAFAFDRDLSDAGLAVIPG